MLTDLDELMLTVHDPESRTYLREALICYRGGAYRAAIVAVWIAVVYDIISKLRVLASQGDNAALASIQTLDNAIANHNLQTLLKFEDVILDEAHAKFQFVNRLEHEDLQRIKHDRHRCAHPAFSSDTLLFNPTAEIVRAHIVHAIKHMLGNPPVQGKAAIDNAVKDIASLWFPRNQEDVEKFMNLTYLNNARESLVSNLVSVLVKALLRRDIATLQGHEDASIMALIAIAKRHSGVYEAKMQDILPRVGTALDDSTIPNVFPLLNVEPRAWGWLDDATKMRAEGLAKHHVFGKGNDAAILDALTVAPLRESLFKRLRQLEPHERLAVIEKNPRAELIDDALTLFEESPNFRDAEPRGRLVLQNMGSMLTLGQLHRALRAVPSNYEIWNASRMPVILILFFDFVNRYFNESKNEWNNMMVGVMKKILEQSPSTKNQYLGLVNRLEAAGLGPFDWANIQAEIDAAAKQRMSGPLSSWRV